MAILDACAECGQNDYENVDGQYYCNYCQTRSQRQEIVHEAEYAGSYGPVREITGASKSKSGKTPATTGLKWTSTDAFSSILFQQAEAIITECSVAENLAVLEAIWLTFIDMNEIRLLADESVKLHPAARYRDVQFVSRDVDELPFYRNKKLPVKSRGRPFRCGKRVAKRRSEVADFVVPFEEEDDNKIPSKSMPSKPQQRFRTLIRSKMNENLAELPEWDSPETQEWLTCDVRKDAEIDDDEPQANKYTKLDDESEEFFGDVRVDLLSRRAKQYSTIIPVETYTDRRNNYPHSFLFIDYLSITKLLAMLYVWLRISNIDVFPSNLIQWVNSGHIPFYNAWRCLPSDWKLISTDVQSYNPKYQPSHDSLVTLANKICFCIGLKKLKSPNMEELIMRYVFDFNLPQKLILVIKKFFNPERIIGAEYTVSPRGKLPQYDKIAIALIIMSMKLLFGLDGHYEIKKSNSLKKLENDEMFIWTDWEKYSTLRLQLIKDYCMPNTCVSDEVKSVDVLVDFYKKVVLPNRMHGSVTTKIQSRCNRYYRSDLSEGYASLIARVNPVIAEKKHVQFPEPQIYNLSSATQFALEQISDDAVTSQLNRDFTTKSLVYIKDTAPYEPLLLSGGIVRTGKSIQWAASFQMLIELGCVVLRCKPHILLPELNIIEKMYLRGYWKCRERRM